MATLYVSEFAALVFDRSNQAVAAPFAPAVAEQSLAITASSTASAPFGAATRFVLINTDTACSLAFNTTASASYHRLAANDTRFYGVNPGSTVSVIVNS